MLSNPPTQETELIQKRPLKEDIFDVLHEKIISGTYKPGDWLRQDDIATQLGVSMTPVREGLDLLVSAGLAERVPDRGVRVREMSDERKLSREFHAAIAKASRNELLIKLYEMVANAFPDWLLYEALFRNPELLANSTANTLREHIAIVEALKKREGIKAAQKSIEHVMDSGKWLEEYLDIPATSLREKEEQVSSLLR